MTRKTVFTALIFLMMLQNGVFGYDTFSEVLINSEKWKDVDFARQVLERDGNGLLNLSVRTLNSEERIKNEISFEYDKKVTAIKSRLSVTRSHITSPFTRDDIQIKTAMNGILLRSCHDDDRARLYSIFIEAFIFDNGSGLAAGWRIMRLHSDASPSLRTTLHHEVIIPPNGITPNVFYDFELKVHPKDRKIHFSIYAPDDADPIAEDTYSHKGLLFPSRQPKISLLTSSENGDAWISSFFDYLELKVYREQGYVTYDDFDPSLPLDLTKWNKGEDVLIINDGKLHMKLSSNGRDDVAQMARLKERVDYLEAKVQIKNRTDFSMDSENSGSAKLFTPLYNDTIETENQTSQRGHIKGKMQLDVDNDRTISAFCEIVRCDDDVCFDAISLFKEAFELPLTFETEYTVSMETTDTAVIFQLEDETITYPFDENHAITHDIANADNSITSEIIGDETTGKPSVFHVTFDDVKVIKEVTPPDPPNPPEPPEPPDENDDHDHWFHFCFISTLTPKTPYFHFSAVILPTLIFIPFLVLIRTIQRKRLAEKVMRIKERAMF